MTITFLANFVQTVLLYLLLFSSKVRVDFKGPTVYFSCEPLSLFLLYWQNKVSNYKSSEKLKRSKSLIHEIFHPLEKLFKIKMPKGIYYNDVKLQPAAEKVTTWSVQGYSLVSTVGVIMTHLFIALRIDFIYTGKHYI